MKKLLLFTTLTLTLLVSVFAFDVAFANQPWNVKAQIYYGDDIFCYDLASNVTASSPECVYYGERGKWQVYQRLRQMQLPDEAIFDYLLPGFSKVTKHFAYLNRHRVDATVSFDGGEFVYAKEQKGVSVEERRLFEMLLQGKSARIQLPLLVDCPVTVEYLKSITVQKGKFTTYFPNSTQNRIHNISLATQAINGTVVGVGQRFSFNEIVGKRTTERGYLNAKVIQDGNYADGVGGGVCQVSTTLYNALLLAEVMPKACQHTLVPAYVLAGFDAMVSDGGADLTFTNDTGRPLYIKGEVVGKSVTFTVFGVANDYQIERECQKQVEPFQTVTVVDRQKYPHLLYYHQQEVVTLGSDGVKSRSYLCYYKNGQLVKRQAFRKNSYRRVDRVVARGPLPTPQGAQLKLSG